MTSGYDVLVLGAGPNGLAAAGYLARAGKRVAVIERGVETGGGLVTQELSGFRLNHHATYMLMAELLPPYRDLDLRDRGVEFVRPEVQSAMQGVHLEIAAREILLEGAGLDDFGHGSRQ